MKVWVGLLGKFIQRGHAFFLCFQRRSSVWNSYVMARSPEAIMDLEGHNLAMGEERAGRSLSSRWLCGTAILRCSGHYCGGGEVTWGWRGMGTSVICSRI